MGLRVGTTKINILKKGFDTKDTDHDNYFFYYKGKKTQIHTKISHGERTLEKELIDIMAKQTKLSYSQFCDFAKCNMSEDEYIKILISKGKIKE